MLLTSWLTARYPSTRQPRYLASSFDQKLDWCISDDVETDFAFAGTLCDDVDCGARQPWQGLGEECGG